MLEYDADVKMNMKLIFALFIYLFFDS